MSITLLKEKPSKPPEPSWAFFVGSDEDNIDNKIKKRREMDLEHFYNI